MKKALKLILEFLLIFLIAGLLMFHELVIYGLGQAKGQLKIVYNAKPIDDILKDKSAPDSLKESLMLINEIRTFAFDSLGINYSSNYTTFYDQKGKPALWVVTASEPFKLKAYEWKFPFLGSVSYKGFFKKVKAITLKNELSLKGYDADVSTVSGWSTLGWFKDPVLSGMLNRSEGDLANVIIHELTHGTLYVKNNVDFNENLASFIGDKGSLLFLKRKYGDTSPEYQEYLSEMQDETIYDDYILKSAKRLDSLYQTFRFLTDVKKQKALKESFITEIISNVDSLPVQDLEYYKRISRHALKAKNAFFMQYIRYDSKQDEFEHEFVLKFNSDLKKYLLFLKHKYPSL